MKQYKFFFLNGKVIISSKFSLKIELFLLEEFLRSEINELNGNQPCSLEFIQTILGEPIISSAWLPNANISNQILVFFGNQNLVLVNANNCENNFLISGITP